MCEIKHVDILEEPIELSQLRDVCNIKNVVDNLKLRIKHLKKIKK